MMKDMNFCKGGSVAHLRSRSVIRVSGGDHLSFLQVLLSCDVGLLETHRVIYGCLLTPQGKILCDLFLWASDGCVLVDIASCFSALFLHRLRLYRLRSDVDFSDISDEMGVLVHWGVDKSGVGWVRDPRHGLVGFRSVVLCRDLGSADFVLSDESAYRIHLLRLGIGDSADDILDSGLFPHEANMDLLHGVSVGKGCYIGQEVVSRMFHRGLVRKRLCPLRCVSFLPEKGMALLLDGKSVGHVSSFFGELVDGSYLGLGLLRLDRLGDDCVVFCGDDEILVSFPDWHPGILGVA